MLTISREARIKVARHAWNVYPLEAFGFLLGRSSEQAVYAALPCSRTQRWREFGDRWNGIAENLDKARKVANRFGLEVVGFYASADGFEPSCRDVYPFPLQSASSDMGLFMFYACVCCPSCSTVSYHLDGRWLKHGEEFFSPHGVRIDKTVNQKRILKSWRQVFGTVAYSAGCVDMSAVRGA
ncbi:MAG: hypothetical protein PHH36_02380 [Sideroxydans sp.]|nr:hypothetical protein [Sideroxydans sp.]